MYSKEEQRRLYDLSKQLLTQSTDLSRSLEEEVNALEAATLVTDLQAILHYHEWRYYVMDDPQIADFEYDTLYKKLEYLEDLYPNLITPEIGRAHV